MSRPGSKEVKFEESRLLLGTTRKTYLHVFSLQLNCCGKGTVTNFLTRITDTLGQTNLCPSSGTSYVSVIMSISEMYRNHTIGHEFILFVGQNSVKPLVGFFHSLNVEPYLDLCYHAVLCLEHLNEEFISIYSKEKYYFLLKRRL